MSIAEVQERYRRFAVTEAPGRSALYEAWALAIAADDELAGVVADFAPQRRQPPLVFAIFRIAGAPEETGTTWRAWVLAHRTEILAAGEGRSVQTNEPLRCAALMPALAGISGPIALIEVGASAGLCLYPDRYAYRYEGETSVSWSPREPSSVLLECETRGPIAPPLQEVQIAWRAGVDLNPLYANDQSDRAWLLSLIWPGESGRAERISGALDIAADMPPVLVSGDATEHLAALVAQAPAGATIVITTPGVLAYLPRARRDELIDLVKTLADHWITIDAPGLHDAWTSSVEMIPADGFALARDGVVLAAADPLGRWIQWYQQA